MKFTGFNSTEKVGIGIGDTVPSVGLQVGNSASGETQLVIFNSEGGVPAGLQVKARTNRAKLHVADNDSNAYVIAEGLRAFFGATGSGASTNIAVQTDGNVGIGTTDPSTPLEVYKNGSGTTFRLTQASTSQYAEMHFNTDTNAYIFKNSSGYTSYGGASSLNIYGDASTPIAFHPGAKTNAVFFATSGNVGIGATTPAKKLTVYDTTPVKMVLQNNSSGVGASDGFEFYLSGNNAGIHNYENGVINFATNNTNRMIISAAGAIQFNTYGSGTHTGTSAYKLSVDSSGNIIETSIGSGAVDGSGTANYIPKWTDGDTIGNSVIREASSKIGIGVSPDEDLHVSATAGARVLLTRTTGDTSSILGAVYFGAENGDKYLASITSYQDGAADSGRLDFTTEATGGDRLARMTIKSDGRVGIGTTAPGGDASSQLLQLGNTLSAGSSAVAQLNGFVRTNFIITHDSAYGIYPETHGQGAIGTSSVRYGYGWFEKLALGTSTFGTATAKLLVGTLLSDGSGAVAQLNGFVRIGSLVTHDASDGVQPNTTNTGRVGHPSYRYSGVYSGLVDISSADPHIKLTDTTTGADALIGANSSVGGMYLIADQNDEGSAAYLDLMTTNASRLILRTTGLHTFTGKVGIGAGSPEYPLHISNADSAIYLVGSTQARIILQDTGATSNSQAFDIVSKEDKLHFRRLTDSRGSVQATVMVLSGDKVGIGTTAPSRPLTIYNGTLASLQLCNGQTGGAGGDGFQMQLSGLTGYLYNYDGQIIFGTSGSNALTLDTSQNATFNGTITGTSATFSGNVSGDTFILPSTASAANQWIYTNNTATGTGSLSIQAGAGSAGYGGGLRMYSHAHASSPGWVRAGISSSSGGKFAVNTHGAGTGSDVFTVDASGVTTISGALTGTSATFSGALKVSYNNPAIDLQESGASRFRAELGSNLTYLSTIGAYNMVLRTNQSAVLTLDSSQNATFVNTATATKFRATSQIVSADNMFMAGGQFYLGAEDGNTDDTYRMYGYSAGKFILQTRKSGTWTTRFDISSAGAATFSGDIRNSGGTGYHVSIVNADIRQTCSTTSQGDWAWNVNTDNTFYVYDYNASAKRLNIKGATGQIQFNSYGGGTHTGTSAYKLSVDSSGNIIETAIGAGAVDGAGTANYVSKWTDGDTIGNSQIFDNGTNVGINDATPTYKLDVNGTFRVTGAATFDSSIYQPVQIVNNLSGYNSTLGWNTFWQEQNGWSNSASAGTFWIKLGTVTRTAANAYSDFVAYVDIYGDDDVQNGLDQFYFRIGTAPNYSTIRFVGRNGSFSANRLSKVKVIRTSTNANPTTGTVTWDIWMKLAGGWLNSFLLKWNYGYNSGSFSMAFTRNQSEVTSEPSGEDNKTEDDFTNTTFFAGKARVGIGTDTPAYDLQIGSYAISEDKTLAILGDNVKNETLRLADESNNWGFDIRNNGGSARLEFIRHSNDSTGTVAVVIQRDDGNVGIGTTAPGAKLDVRGADGYLKFDTSGSDGTIKSDYNLKLYADDNNNNSSGYQNIQFYTAGANERMRINNAGNVGIGTTTPSSRLTVDGSSSVGSSVTIKTGTGAGALEFVGRSADDNSSISWYGNNGSSGGSYLQSSGIWMRARADGGFHFRKGNTPTVTDTDGFTIEGMNVGINVADPDAKLEIKGAGGGSGLTFKTTDVSDNEVFYIQDGGRVGLRFWPLTVGIPSSTAVSGVKFQVEEAGFLTVLNDGNVGIGTTTPSYRLDVEQTTGVWTAGIRNTHASGYGLSIDCSANSGTSTYALAVYTGSNVGMFVTNQSRVGIGTATPSQALDVYGNVTVDAGGVIIEDTGEQLKFGDSNVAIDRNVNDIVLHGYNGHIFTRNAGETMRLNSSGSVGIGTTSPGAPLVVVGTGDNARIGSASDGVVIAHASGVGYLQGTDTGGSAYNALGFKTSANYALYIDTSDRVGIGNAAPAYRLEVTGSATADWISKIHNTATTSTPSGLIVKTDYNVATATGGYLLGLLAGTDYRLVVQNDGNVGIGTITPGYLLDVRGTVFVNGTTYIAADTRIRGKLSRDGGPVSAGTETWFIRPSASNTVIVALTNSAGGALENGGCYRFTAHINGTGTDQSARAVFWNQNGTWYVNKTSQYSGTSNQPEFLVSSSVPSIKTSHSSQYLIPTMCERIVLDEGTGTDNTREYYGADGFMSSITSTEVLSYNVGTTTSRTVYHSGNFTPGNYLPLAGGTMTGQLFISYSNARVTIKDGSDQLNIGQWDGSNHRIEGDANRPIVITSYQGNINLGTSGSTKLNVNTGGIALSGHIAAATNNVYDIGASDKFFRHCYLYYIHCSTLTASGNCTLGDASTDVHTINGVLYANNSIIIPNASYYFGAKNTSGAAVPLMVLNSSNAMILGSTTLQANSYPIRTLAKYITFEPAGTLGAGVETMRITNGSFNSVGSVGIGTASPGSMLEIQSSVITEPVFTVNSNYAGVQAGQVVFRHGRAANALSNNDSLGDIIFQGFDSGGGLQNFAAISSTAADVTAGSANGIINFTTFVDGASAERMRIHSNGNVGIGTTSPNAKLDVHAASTELMTATWHYGQLEIVDSSAYNSGFSGGITFKRNRDATPNKIQVAGIGAYGSTVGASGLAFFTNNGTNVDLLTEKMRIQSNGCVGIGTNDPSNLLHVNGQARFNQATVSGSGVNLPFLVTTSNGNDICHLTSQLTTYARVRVDCSAPGDAQIAFMSSQSSKWSIGNDAGDSHKFKIKTGLGAFSGGERFMIQADGNVGIGTNTAGYKFQVYGDILASGAIMGNSKSFVIDHPTKPNHKLQYGALEGPEFGVYHRGRAQSDTITLPDYWVGLVREGTVTVQLTPNGSFQHLYVVSTSLTEIKIGAADGETIDCYYVIYGERADLDPLVVEKIV